MERSSLFFRRDGDGFMRYLNKEYKDIKIRDVVGDLL